MGLIPYFNTSFSEFIVLNILEVMGLDFQSFFF